MFVIRGKWENGIKVQENGESAVRNRDTLSFNFNVALSQ